MSTAVFVAVAAFVLVAVAASMFFSEGARVRRALKATPTVAIRDFSGEGPARIVGAVVGFGPTLVAPLSGRPCVYYQVTVEEHRTNGKHSHWHEVASERRGVAFVVDDGTGRALVEPEGAKVAVVKDSTSRSGTFDDATPEEEAFLQRQGLKSTGLVFNRPLRYVEGVFEVGETVAVLGRGY